MCNKTVFQRPRQYCLPVFIPFLRAHHHKVLVKINVFYLLKCKI